ncbi:phosphotransferase [Parahaliea sp. F7430]|uniref:Phosphotransferase n=1 Tax=Sediminihaliea albiluteola TaxID=2758564 RepID=A0A7W2TUY3_9GAMM|nr:phosphotransferase [Sediminihaliea albiluteola]
MAASTQTQIDSAAQAWIKLVLKAKSIELQRMLVRREAWQITAELNSGDKASYFLRIDRDALRGEPGTRGLKRESDLMRCLAEHSQIPIPKVLAWSDEHCIAIQSFVSGRADLNNAAPEEQHSVMQHFMDILAEMHQIDVDQFNLEGFELPSTAEEHSLIELDAVDSQVD